MLEYWFLFWIENFVLVLIENRVWFIRVRGGINIVLFGIIACHLHLFLISFCFLADFRPSDEIICVCGIEVENSGMENGIQLLEHNLSMQRIRYLFEWLANLGH